MRIYCAETFDFPARRLLDAYTLPSAFYAAWAKLWTEKYGDLPSQVLAWNVGDDGVEVRVIAHIELRVFRVRIVWSRDSIADADAVFGELAAALIEGCRADGRPRQWTSIGVASLASKGMPPWQTSGGGQ